MRPDRPCSLSLFQMIPAHGVGDDAVLQCTKATLVQLSHTLEDMILHQHLPALLFTGFQHAAHWRQAESRYRELAAIAQYVGVFAGGELPPDDQPNVVHVALHPDDPLCQEWFMVVVAPQFSVVLCGKEHPHSATDDDARPFDTLWSFDPVVVEHVLAVLNDITAVYRPDRLAVLHHARSQIQVCAPALSLITLFTLKMIRFEEALHARLRTTTNALTKQLRWRDDVVATLVHDMRTPLSSLMMALELLETSPALNANDIALSLTFARRSTTNLHTMIQLILDTNKLDAGHLEPRWHMHAPQLLFDKGLASLDRTLAGSHTRLTMYIDPQITGVWGDESLLSRVIQNLVSNALKFTQPGGLIDMTLQRAPVGPMIELRVHDTGRGIAAEQVPHLFERYYQGDPQDLRGSGLGLYFCKLVAEAHHGHIHVTSHLGVGTTFTISLPAGPPQCVDAAI